jgi:hypothetical protein
MPTAERIGNRHVLQTRGVLAGQPLSLYLTQVLINLVND